jgi:predicted porin
MEVNTDAGNNGDEVWAFLSGDFGRVEMGDQDDATNRMLVGAFQAHKGISGPFGGLGGILPVFHNALGSPYHVRTDWQVITSSDDTKITYFSPRFAGFQVGASFTPDSGGMGASFGEPDNDGDFENMIGIGINFTEKFGDVGVSASVLYETAGIEDVPNGGPTSSGGTGANTLDDLEILYVGAKIDFAGFTVGANYRDHGDSFKTSELPGFDLGNYWAVAAGYQQGPWGVSAWYSRGEGDIVTGIETTVDRWGIGGRYAIAPGWQIRADYNNNVNELTGAPDLESQAFILTNMFNF